MLVQKFTLDGFGHILYSGLRAVTMGRIEEVATLYDIGKGGKLGTILPHTECKEKSKTITIHPSIYLHLQLTCS